MIRLMRRHTAGFTLTEMAIVLGVVGVLIAGLWNLISGASQQARDEAVASQQTQLINAVKEFLLSSQGQQFMTINNSPTCGGGDCPANKNFPLPLPAAANAGGTAGCYTTDPALLAVMPGANPSTGYSERQAWCGFLPPGFSAATVNSYGQTYAIQVLRDATANPDTSGNATAPNSYSFMIMTTGAVIPDTSGSRISALIGGDGGFIFTGPVCTAAASTTVACGSYGGWTADAKAVYGFAAPATPNPASGTVASRTYMSAQQTLLNNWLARVQMDPNYAFNTMTVPEYLGDNALVMGKYTAGAPDTTNTIYMGDYNGGVPLNNGGTFNMQGGVINFQYGAPVASGLGTINMQGGTVNAQAGSIYLQGGILTTNAGGTADGSTISLLGNMTYGVLNLGPPAPLTVGSGCKTTYPPTQGTQPFVPANAPNYGPPFCQVALQVNGDANLTGTLSANGLYAGTFIYQSSDIRLKTDIRPIPNPLTDIMRLKPVSFTLRASGQKGLGVIAQDIEKVYPQLVSEGEMKSVNYDGLIGPLIGAVQQLEKENTELREQMEQENLRQKKIEDELHSGSQNQ